MFTLFRKIPVTITPAFWILSFIVGFLSTHDPLSILLWMGIVLISVVVHELGHALFSIFWGQKVRIELGAFGGATILESGAQLTPLKEFMVIIMGPFFGFLLAGIVYMIPLWDVPTAAHILYLMIVVNIFWSMINLLPVHPLDGGKLMSIVFQNIFGHAGLRFSYFLSTIFGLIFGLMFMSYRVLVLGALFLLFSYDSFRTWQQAKFKAPRAVEQKIAEQIDQAVGDWLSEHPQEAIQKLEAICDGPQRGDAYLEALERLCHYLLITKQPQKAYKRLMDAKMRLSIDGLVLLQLASYETLDYIQALKTGEKIFQEGASISDCALINAFCAARLDKVDIAINWLKSAQQEGSLDMKTILSSDDFESIRNMPAFKQFAATI